MKDWLRGAFDALIIGSAIAFAGVVPLEQAVSMIPQVVPAWNGGDLTYVQPDTGGCYGTGWPMSEDLAPNSPYKEAWLTQGIHGCDYGHAAIDMVAVGDTTIYAPITGCVTRNGYDGVGNTVWVIENEQYQVTLLHGVYNVYPPECVKRGFPIGVEAGIGRSTKPHAHMNVYDEICGCNVNPRLLIKLD